MEAKKYRFSLIIDGEITLAEKKGDESVRMRFFRALDFVMREIDHSLLNCPYKNPEGEKVEFKSLKCNTEEPISTSI